MAFDWTAGYSSEFRVHRVNTATWMDGRRLERVRSIDVERADSDLPESGSMKVTCDPADFERGYYRVVMVAEQGAFSERVEMATLLFESGDGERDKGTGDVSATGRCVLWPASRANAWREGFTCAVAGSDGAEMAARMLRACIAAPVFVEGSFTLSDTIVFDDTATVLDCAWMVVRAGGFTLRIDGHGTVHVMPKPTAPSLALDAANAKLIAPAVPYEFDSSGVPNRYTAVDGGVEAVAVNDDPESPVSTVSRGYVDDVRDSSPARVDGESLAEYARRRLSELSVVGDSREYKREWWPDVTVGDIVRGSLARVGLEGDMRVTRQKVECKHGALVTERAEKEITLWQG